jgi:thioredoxin 1
MLNVTDSNFQAEVLDSNTPVVVDFWAEWCGPCKMLTPILEELATELSTVKIAKLNIDQNPQISSQLNIRSVPTMLLFKNGNAVSTLVGLNQKQKIKTWIEANL